MIVELSMDKFGDVYICPTNERYRKKIRDYMKTWVPHGAPDDDRVFIQEANEDQLAEDFNLSKAELRTLNRGWSLRKRVDDWTFLHYYGWDCHTLAESGELYGKARQ